MDRLDSGLVPLQVKLDCRVLGQFLACFVQSQEKAQHRSFLALLRAAKLALNR